MTMNHRRAGRAIQQRRRAIHARGSETFADRTVLLAPREAELLKHRLGAPDAIAQALTDRPEEEEPCPWPRERIAEAAYLLRQEVERHSCIILVDDLDIAIVEDCMAGSTIFGCLQDARAPTIRAYRHAAECLQGKLAQVAGRALDGFPLA